MQIPISDLSPFYLRHLSYQQQLFLLNEHVFFPRDRSEDGFWCISLRIYIAYIVLLSTVLSILIVQLQDRKPLVKWRATPKIFVWAMMELQTLWSRKQKHEIQSTKKTRWAFERSKLPTITMQKWAKWSTGQHSCQSNLIGLFDNRTPPSPNTIPTWAAHYHHLSTHLRNRLKTPVFTIKYISISFLLWTRLVCWGLDITSILKN